MRRRLQLLTQHKQEHNHALVECCSSFLFETNEFLFFFFLFLAIVAPIVVEKSVVYSTDIVTNYIVYCKISEGPGHGLSHFWITDSCPLTVNAVKDRQPFEILSLAGPIASALQI